MSKRIISVTLDVEVLTALRQKALNEDVSVSELVNSVLKNQMSLASPGNFITKLEKLTGTKLNSYDLEKFQSEDFYVLCGAIIMESFSWRKDRVTSSVKTFFKDRLRYDAIRQKEGIECLGRLGKGYVTHGRSIS